MDVLLQVKACIWDRTRRRHLYPTWSKSPPQTLHQPSPPAPSALPSWCPGPPPSPVLLQGCEGSGWPSERWDEATRPRELRRRVSAAVDVWGVQTRHSAVWSPLPSRQLRRLSLLQLRSPDPMLCYSPVWGHPDPSRPQRSGHEGGGLSSRRQPGDPNHL